MQAVQETAGEVPGLQVAEDAQEQPGPYPIEKLQVGRRSPGPVLRTLRRQRAFQPERARAGARGGRCRHKEAQGGRHQHRGVPGALHQERAVRYQGHQRGKGGQDADRGRAPCCLGATRACASSATGQAGLLA